MRYAVASRRQLPASLSAITERIDALERMSAFLRAAVADASESQRRARPGPEPDAFSLHEHVWHLRDIEVLAYSVRVRAIATETAPFLPDLDGTRMALERGYLAAPLQPALRGFERQRAANVALLRAMPLAAFERRGELEGVGCIALAELLDRWCGHDAVHRREIAALGAS